MATSSSISRTPLSGAISAAAVDSIRAKLGRTVLGVWLLVTGASFWFRLARPTLRPRLAYKDGRAVRSAQRWYAEVVAGLKGNPVATVVLVPGTGCRCETPPLESFCRLAQRWRPQGLRFIIGDRAAATTSISDEASGRILTLASAPRLPLGMNLLVFDRQGRLQSAGPLMRGITAGAPISNGGATILEGLFERLVEDAPRAAAPMLYRPDCTCCAN